MLQRDKAGGEEGTLGDWIRQTDHERGEQHSGEDEGAGYSDQHNTNVGTPSGCSHISLH